MLVNKGRRTQFTMPFREKKHLANLQQEYQDERAGVRVIHQNPHGNVAMIVQKSLPWRSYLSWSFKNRTPMKTNKKLNSFDKQTHFVTPCVVFLGGQKDVCTVPPPYFYPLNKNQDLIE